MPQSDYDKDKQARRQAMLTMQKKWEEPIPQVASAPDLPKTFKEKSKHFFYYYKFHLLAVAFVLFIIIMTIVGIASRNAIDASMTIVSEASFEGASPIIQKNMADILPDYDKNGKQTLDITIIQLEGNEPSGQSEQMIMMNQSKLVAEASTGKRFLYLLDEHCYKQLVDIGVTFKDLSTIASSEFIEGDKYILTDTKLSEDLELSDVLDNMFFCLADFDKYDEKAQNDKKLQEGYNNEKDLLTKMIAIN